MVADLRRKQDQAGLVEPNFDCNRCQDTRWEVVAGKGARPCPDCAEAARRARLLSKPEFALYHDVSLETLEARPDMHWKQPAIIKRVKEQPDASYGFFGLNRIGKTHIGYAIYRHAVESGRPGVAVPAYQLLRELTDLEFNEQARPAITANSLFRTDARWCIFIDDLTALPRFSAFGVNQFYQIFNAVIQKGHQLIVTAHATEAMIEDAFNQGGTNMGASIIGRIRNADRMMIPSGLMQLEAK